MKRLSSFKLTTKEQLRVIVSSKSNEIIQALRVSGPSSAKELGPKIGKKSNSLHYHLNRLVECELIRVVDKRRSGARVEKIYDVVAERFIGDDYLESEDLRQIVVKGVGSFLRSAEREFDSATQAEGEPMAKHPRKLIGSRYTANLTKRQLVEINKHFNAISKIFAENSGNEKGQRFTFTAVLAPVLSRQESNNKE